MRMLETTRRSQTGVAAETATEANEAADEAGLIYVRDDEPGISRKSVRGGFAYFDPKGERVRNEAVLRRIRSLAVPPAYSDVWICPKARGHIQATGRDARRRKQYRYHPRWNEARDQTKYDRLPSFAAVLPGLRARVREDMAKSGLPREKVLATIVNLLEATLIRVGNEDYAQKNKSYGLTTLRNGHVAVTGSELRFRFKGKSGKSWTLNLKDRRVSKIVRACQELPGQRLFEFMDEQLVARSVNSSDVNAYLHEATGQDITAKDFRTWHGTVLAAMALSEFEAFDTQSLAKRNVRAAIEQVAARLGNTLTVCRKCYIHPQIISSYLDGRLLEEIQLEIANDLSEDLARLRPEEEAVLALLGKRLKAEMSCPGAK
jgi:DNA topoisomerase I